MKVFENQLFLSFESDQFEIEIEDNPGHEFCPPFRTFRFGKGTIGVTIIAKSGTEIILKRKEESQ